MAMTYRIEYISTFYEDILAVNEFLVAYPRKAVRVFAKADKAISILETMPELYPIYNDVPAYRAIVIEDYMVFYKVKKQDRLVEIHRLIYGRMDIPIRLQE